MSTPEIAAAIVRVGDGRGFVATVPDYRGRPLGVVITAAHCLPVLPEPHAMNGLNDLTYGDLVGTIGGPPSLWVECLFADPVADLAILGAVDGQALYDEAEAFEALVDGVTPLRLAPARPGSAWVYDLTGTWQPVEVTNVARDRLALQSGRVIIGGMSGSPIIQDGAAIGALSTSTLSPCLTLALPGWATRATDPLALGTD